MWPRRSSLPFLGDALVGIAYVGGTLILTGVTGYSVVRLAGSTLAKFDHSLGVEASTPSRAAESTRWSLAGFVPPQSYPAPDEPTEGNVIQTADNMPWWDRLLGGGSGDRGASGDWGRRSGLLKVPPAGEERRRRGSEDDDSPRSRLSSGTYRTVCVRLCDGYFFPISAATHSDRFKRDEKTCESRCGGTQAKLYVYKNEGGSPEDMQDIRGEAYSKLKTAFLYRTQYVGDCRCQPQPWEDAAIAQHKSYAEAALRKRGGKRASGSEPPANARRSAAYAEHVRSVGPEPLPAPLPRVVSVPAAAGRGQGQIETRSSLARNFGTSSVIVTPGLPAHLRSPDAAPPLQQRIAAISVPATAAAASGPPMLPAAAAADPAAGPPPGGSPDDPPAPLQPGVKPVAPKTAHRARDDGPPMRLGRAGRDSDSRPVAMRSSGSGRDWRSDVFQPR